MASDPSFHVSLSDCLGLVSFFLSRICLRLRFRQSTQVHFAEQPTLLRKQSQYFFKHLYEKSNEVVLEIRNIFSWLYHSSYLFVRQAQL